MNTFLILLFFFFVFALIVGLIKPTLVIKWGDVSKRNRKKVLLYFVPSVIVSFFAIGLTVDTTSPEYIASQKQIELDNQKRAEEKEKKAKELENKKVEDEKNKTEEENLKKEKEISQVIKEESNNKTEPSEKEEPNNKTTPSKNPDDSKSPFGKVSEKPVINGSKTEKIGTYAEVMVGGLEITEENLVKFYEDVVKDSEYNWVTLNIDGKTGIQFPGSSYMFTYGEIDSDACVIEGKGDGLILNNAIDYTTR